MKWKICATSLRGSSHLESGLPCQDSSKHRSIQTQSGDYIILVASDGCGTAKYSDVGADIITSEVADCIGYWLQKSRIIADLSELIAYSFGHANQCLAKEAHKLSISVNELAATCICLVIGPDRYAAAQIGDGVVIGLSNSVCGCLFWPNQEYANVTHTLTGKDWRLNTQTIAINSGSNMPDGWFLATDGIQAISCDYQKKAPVSGFASVLVDKFRSISVLPGQNMDKTLELFLQSERVNSAVSDDKTVILAFR